MRCAGKARRYTKTTRLIINKQTTMHFNDEDVGVYRQFYNYDFEGNSEYNQGLEAVLQKYLMMEGGKNLEIKNDLDSGNLDTTKIKPDVKEQLISQTKVFFFCKQTGNILDYEDYKQWLASKPDLSEVKEPPYSTNYDELVDMIVNNKPIPGIKTIPDTVLDPSKGSEHIMKERKKPWQNTDKS